MPDREQRPESTKSTSAPSIQHGQDERGGSLQDNAVASQSSAPQPDEVAYITFSSAEGKGSRIFMSTGSPQKKITARVGAKGYVEEGGMALAEFVVETVTSEHAIAWVPLPQPIKPMSTRVVLSPTHVPKAAGAPRNDIRARVTGRNVIDGVLQITIGSGEAQGVRDGMDAYIDDHDHTRITPRKIYGTKPDTCYADLVLKNEQMFSQVVYVVINPGKS